MTKRPGSYDPSEDVAILLGVGSAHAVSDPDEPESPAGEILLPFAGQRGGWRLGGWGTHAVARVEQPRARQPIGFRPR